MAFSMGDALLAKLALRLATLDDLVAGLAGKQDADADLSAIAALSTTGVLSRTGSATYATRTLAGTSNRITVTNGDGVSGAPTFDISSAYVGQNTITTLGTVTTGTWNGTTIAIANGGTGQTSAAAAFNALAPTTTQGDIIYRNGSGNTRLAAGTATQVLHGGTTPSWAAVALAADVSGTLPVGNGGTNITSYTAGDLIYASGSTTLNKLAAGSATQVLHGGTTPSWGSISLTADVSGTLPLGNGGTGQTTAQAAMNALAGGVTNNRVLRANGTNVVLAQVGLTTDVTGVLPAANGGTGVANSSNLTLGGALTTSGAFASTFTMTGTTAVTFPTAGTLLSAVSTTVALPSNVNFTGTYFGYNQSSPQTFNQNQSSGLVVGNGTGLPGVTLYGSSSSGASFSFASGTTGAQQYQASWEYDFSSKIVSYRCDSVIRFQLLTTYARFKSDNYGLYWGAGDDLGIYHDGTDSFLDNATGNLKVRQLGVNVMQWDVNGNQAWLGSGTNGRRVSIVSTGGNGLLGVEASVAGTTFVGSTAYAMVFGSDNNTDLCLASNSRTRMTLTKEGSQVLGEKSALATTATDGFTYIPTCAGTPTGVPTAITGKVPMVFDTTNSKLYIYVGGAWKSSTFT